MYQWGLGTTAHFHSPHIPALTSDLSSHVQCGAVVVVMWCSGGHRSLFMVVWWEFWDLLIFKFSCHVYLHMTADQHRQPHQRILSHIDPHASCCGNQPLIGLSCWGMVGGVIIRWDSQQKYVLKYM